MPDFNIVAEVDINPTPKRAEGWMDALADYSPAVGRTPRGRAELIITIPARSLEQAINTGLAILSRAAGQLAAFAVLATSDFDARSEDVPLPQLVGATEAAEIVGVSRQRIQQMADAGQLPHTRVGNALAFPRQVVEALGRAETAARTGKRSAVLDAIAGNRMGQAGLR
jgi:excisionase family DNA binding protein